MPDVRIPTKDAILSGELERVAHHAIGWFRRYLQPGTRRGRPRDAGREARPH